MVTASILTPTLQIGARGTAVVVLQELLEDHLRVSLSKDGTFSSTFDEEIESLVRRFQALRFLEVDGIVGPLTWRLLREWGTEHLPLLKRGDRGELVKRLQQALHLGPKTGPLNAVQSLIGTRGYYFGQIDGDFGPMTEQAILAFQKNPPSGREPITPFDGIVGPKTWAEVMGLVNDIALA
ncbi:MAG: peptidoglycan-binding protein [Cyanobacteria bacterium J06649_4]